MEIHPNLVILETSSNRQGDQTDIEITCNGMAEAAVCTCTSPGGEDSLVAKMIRSNVKRLVCRATANAGETNIRGLNYALPAVGCIMRS